MGLKTFSKGQNNILGVYAEVGWVNIVGLQKGLRRLTHLQNTIWVWYNPCLTNQFY